MSKHESKGLGRLWDNYWSKTTADLCTMGNPAIMQEAARFLNVPDIVTVEDWGCGIGQFKPYLARHQQWIGVDGCGTSGAIKIEALDSYRSDADGLYMRGVLEHNPETWEAILRNALASFTRRAVIVLWLPLVEEPEVNARNYFPLNRIGREDFNRVFTAGTRECAVETIDIKNHNSNNKGLIETLYCIEK